MAEDPKISAPANEFPPAAKLVQGESLCMAGVEPRSPAQMFRLQIMSGTLANVEAASKLGLTPPAFKNFLEGTLPVDQLLAEKLSEATGTSSGFWMNIQAAYEFGQSKRGQSLLRQAASAAPIMKMG